MHSSARITAFLKFLVALSATFTEAEDPKAGAIVVVPKPSLRRRRLHILYLLNDLLHHTKYHDKAFSSAFSTLTGTLQPHLVELFEHAASYQSQKYPKHHSRVTQLLDVWERHNYYSLQYINKLRESVGNAANLDLAKGEHVQAGSNGNASLILDRGAAKDIPFVMPATHGDPATAYYDLPAANMMPHIVPNAAIPINPKLLKPLQFVAGPAHETLVNALRDFMQEVESMDAADDDVAEKTERDTDELGQPLVKDSDTGEIVGGDGYYGWSRSFCQKMKRRKAGKGLPDQAARGRSDSSKQEANYRKRTRRGHSESGSSRSRSRGRSRSMSRSRSNSPDKDRYRESPRSRFRNRSNRNFHSGSPPQRYRSLRSRSRSQSRSRSRSKSYSPPHDLPRPQPVPTHDERAFSNHPQGVALSTLPPFFGALTQGFPLGPGGIPIPPPPPDYTGSWPPPPPPILPGMGFPSHPGRFPAIPGFVPQPIPPPPSGPRGLQGQGHPATGAWSLQQQLVDYNQGYGNYVRGGPPAPNEANHNSRGRGGTRGGRRP